jgi:hypothetical protein
METFPRLSEGCKTYGELRSLKGCVWMSPLLNMLRVVFVLVPLSSGMVKAQYHEKSTRLEAKRLEL